MKYAMFLWPHANVRYRNEATGLAQAELALMLGRAAPEASLRAAESHGMSMIEIDAPGVLPDAALSAIARHSLLYGLFELREDGALMPAVGREKAYLGEDLPGILKYKGKTNEMFLQLLINAALYSGDHWLRAGEKLRIFDPMCGRATSLFIAANRQWSCTGADIDKNDLKEAEKFFKRYLEYHRFKHELAHTSLTVRGGKPASVAQFTFSDSIEHYKQKSSADLRLVHLDAEHAREAFGRDAFHLIVCDLPYGVQHNSNFKRPEALLEQALPNWRETLVKGGTIAISFNAQTLKTERVRELMAQAGLTPLSGGAYDGFLHWVEQAITRDIAVCRK